MNLKKESTKISPLEYVVSSHKRYLDYEMAFENNPFNVKVIEDKLQELFNKGVTSESDEFLDEVIPLMLHKPKMSYDVKLSATLFMMSVDFYTKTNSEPLPDNVLEDYDSLPEIFKDSNKFTHVISDGKFELKEKLTLTDEELKMYKDVYNKTKDLYNEQKT